ncbi:Bug family tripartite tricarboxylate transporter substrate binding protein [Alicycliphilus denitrificans]|uniref:Tripartite tricarboxylate transporter substrate binding protein n=1 Tax=Alicycliphilus denitrificans TaxID=179636 RepID=A0A420KGY1_9BURK|nr:tripartite tricarboxylate transporter substrate binding protein [Alicycliphilus denitrificans]RKJ99191.1 tripartite tricarboxylate transporter substrate binding protein [Alicycliphilus denitrificans]
MTINRRSLLQAMSTIPAAAWLPSAHADKWPVRPVKFVCPFAAGGATDMLSRIYAEHMSRALGSQMIVDNRTGAGGTVGLSAVERSSSDGYTVGMMTNGTHIFSKALLPQMPYDTDKGFTYIAGLWDLPNVLVMHPSVPAQSVPELIQLLKANPDKYSFASAGVGTSTHIAAELFCQTAGVKMTHVPYRGGAPANLDLLSGVVHLYFDNITGSVENIKAGKVRALGVTSLQRNPALPDVPAVAEYLPGFECTSWTGVAGPAGVPRAIAETLEAATLKVLADKELAQKFARLGATPYVAKGADVKKRMQAEEKTLLPKLHQMNLQAK